YMVAFPQRRGRGKSQGLYDEGFNVDRTQGYACDPKQSLPGADRALIDIDAAVEVLRQRPDVAGQPILMRNMGKARDDEALLSVCARQTTRFCARDSRSAWDRLRGFVGALRSIRPAMRGLSAQSAV